MRAAEAGVGGPMLSSEMAGHVRMLPGPALAAWLGQTGPGQLDEAGLVNSITGWRKLTSWAQAQELAAVAELGRRRGVMDDPEADRDPVRELSAEFAPNEVALALTLTQYAAEWWMSLAVSMSRRLPATWSALSQGTIDLARAKLVNLWTTPLDDDLARAVERKVLVRAGADDGSASRVVAARGDFRGPRRCRAPARSGRKERPRGTVWRGQRDCRPLRPLPPGSTGIGCVGPHQRDGRDDEGRRSRGRHRPAARASVRGAAPRHPSAATRPGRPREPRLTWCITGRRRQPAWPTRRHPPRAEPRPATMAPTPRTRPG